MPFLWKPNNNIQLSIIFVISTLKNFINWFRNGQCRGYREYVANVDIDNKSIIILSIIVKKANVKSNLVIQHKRHWPETFNTSNISKCLCHWSNNLNFIKMWHWPFLYQATEWYYNTVHIHIVFWPANP